MIVNSIPMFRNFRSRSNIGTYFAKAIMLFLRGYYSPRETKLKLVQNIYSNDNPEYHEQLFCHKCNVLEELKKPAYYPSHFMPHSTRGYMCVAKNGKTVQRTMVKDYQVIKVLGWGKSADL